MDKVIEQAIYSQAQLVEKRATDMNCNRGEN